MQLQEANAALVKIQHELDVAKTAAVAQAHAILSTASAHAEAHEAEARAAREIIATAESIVNPKSLELGDSSPKFLLTKKRLQVPRLSWRVGVLIVAALWVVGYLIYHHA